MKVAPQLAGDVVLLQPPGNAEGVELVRGPLGGKRPRFMGWTKRLEHQAFSTAVTDREKQRYIKRI